MKVIIAGSRSITDPFYVGDALSKCSFLAEITEIVSGGAAGVDILGEKWAEILGIPVKYFPAKWEKYGRGAGMVRNQQMGWYADGLVAVWDRKSRGTAHMIEFMERLRKPTYVYTVTVGKETSGAVGSDGKEKQG